MQAVKLHPHQEEAVEKLGNGKILHGQPGVGKSITAMAYFVSKVCGGTYGDFGSMRTPKDIYIITTAKKRDSRDWDKEAIQFGISTNRDASRSGIKLTVDSWNNIDKYLEVKDAFFIFDEQRSVGSGAWAQSLIKIAKHNEWIMLTATPGDTWLDYITVFVANGWYKNRTEFKRRHVVYSNYGNFPKVDRYIEVGTLVRHRNNILVHMPYVRHTVRHDNFIKVGYNKELFDKVVNDRWHVYEQRPLRDVAELFTVMRKVVNSDSSRLLEIRKLMSQHSKLIVFYNFDYELEILRTLGMSRNIEADSESISQKASSNNQIIFQTTPIISNGTSGTTESGSTEKDKTDGFMSDQIDPLKETIWEMGWNEKEAFEKAGLSVVETSKIFGSFSSSNPGKSTESNTGSTTLRDHPGTSMKLLSPEHSETHSICPTAKSKSVMESPTPLQKKNQSGVGTSPGTDSFTVAEWNGHKHEPIPETERWVYLVQYTAGSEGWNCVETDAMVFYSLTYSWKAYWQAHGRIDRLNTPFINLWYYSLVSDSMIDKAIQKSLKSKKSFNERDLPIWKP